MEKVQEVLYSASNYFGSLQLFEFIIFLIIVYKYNPFNISTHYPVFTQFFVLIVGFLYVTFFLFLQNTISLESKIDLSLFKVKEKDFLIKIIIYLVFIFLFIGITAGIFWLFRNLALLTTLFRHSLLLFIIIGIIGLIYLLTKNINVNVKNLFGLGPGGPNIETNKPSLMLFFTNLVLFLPCLLIKIIDYGRYQFNLTTKPIWILFFLEIILISLWVLLPLLFNRVVHRDGTTLLTDPKYINEEYTLGNFENLAHNENLTNINPQNNPKNKFKHNYSLSSWFYLNPQPPNTSPAYTKYTSILNYGNKPNVQYNGQLNSLRVMTTIHEDEQVEIFQTTKVIYQKWNHLVVNYDGGTMDVFLNGELVGSRPNIAPYMTFENVVSGAVNGLQGGICNVVYYDHILSNQTIQVMYRLLRDKKVPLLF